jgi:ABC-type molybdate transport system substrate-binding protein
MLLAMLFRFHRLVLAAVALILMAAQPVSVRAGEALVAVATNFLEPARKIVKQFEAG